MCQVCWLQQLRGTETQGDGEKERVLSAIQPWLGQFPGHQSCSDLSTTCLVTPSLKSVISLIAAETHSPWA